ncbi:MAG: LysR family transcriptional regulator [Lachnospiraceae bacterium]
MTLQQLKYAITVADNNSINEAAKELFISQPTLSNAIKELEKEIGITIFMRNNKGISILSEGAEFLGYARQVVEQSMLLEEKYLGGKPKKIKFSVSTQHYSFAVNAFVDLIQEYNMEEYDFMLRETRTYEIIEDVKNCNSEIGILYLNQFNEKIIKKLLLENDLKYTELFTATPHVFVSRYHPLGQQSMVTLKELEPYPYLSFEQGNFNSFYFSEEILSILPHKKSIKVSDRGTLFNLLIGLNGYTICSGIISRELNGEDILAIPLKTENEIIRIGYIIRQNTITSRLGEQYLEKLKKHCLGISVAESKNSNR